MSIPLDKRIQKVLDEIASRTISGSDPKSGGNANKSFAMEAEAQEMLMEYAKELTVSIMESSKLLAQHRNSTEISEEDVKLAIVKKLDSDLGSTSQLKQSHESVWKSAYLASLPQPITEIKMSINEAKDK